MSPLPEQAVDPAVIAHIRRQLAAGNFDGAVYPCRCQYLDMARSWRLCAYHDGLNDGMAMADTVTCACGKPATGTAGGIPVCGDDR